MYEHCGSWVEPALRTAAAAAGFAVSDVRAAHSGQFLVLEAEPVGEGEAKAEVGPDDVAPLVAAAAAFGDPSAAGCRAGVSGSPSTPATGVRWWPGAPADAA